MEERRHGFQMVMAVDQVGWHGEGIEAIDNRNRCPRADSWATSPSNEL